MLVHENWRTLTILCDRSVRDKFFMLSFSTTRNPATGEDSAAKRSGWCGLQPS
ncbi:hypothetical protein H6G27_02665 [Nostoc linckia FACHB-104]|nr:hypothetical protein [Nostoc linckia FACHB-104]